MVVPLSSSTFANLGSENLSDLFSFYKEELAGDYDNMIHRRATVNNQDVLEALRDTAEDILLAVERVRRNLTGREKEMWEIFIAKYVSFHCFTKRYRVSEIAGF